MSNDTESTHFVFDGQSMQISPNIRKIFDFLMEIEKESDAIFGVEKQLAELRDYYRDLLECTSELSRVLKENNIDNWSYDFKKDPRNFTDALEYHLPVRTQMIQLFTQLEVMYFLYLSYSEEIDSEDKLREVAMKEENRKAFLRQFILNDTNSYYKTNIERFKKLDAGKIVRLRNALVHFFSLSSDAIGIHPDRFGEDARKFERHAAEQNHGQLVLMSPLDLSELIKGAYMILFQIWTEDTLHENEKFKRKIKHVHNVVSEFGAVIVYYKGKDVKQ